MPAVRRARKPAVWAGPGADHARVFKDVVVWLPKQLAFTVITLAAAGRWTTVGPIVARVTADHLEERWLGGLAVLRSVRAPDWWPRNGFP